MPVAAGGGSNEPGKPAPAEAKPVPLTRYRRRDEARRREMDALQDEVSAKVAEVMDSFRNVPPQGGRSHDPERILRQTRPQVVHCQPRSPSRPTSRLGWLFLLLVCLGFLLILLGWTQ